MRVVGINRYPVKSLQGEQLSETTIDPTGLDGDRRWGIVEAETGKVWSAKRHGALARGQREHHRRGPDHHPARTAPRSHPTTPLATHS